MTTPGRTRRDRAADAALFLLAIALTTLGVIDNLDQRPAPVPFTVDAVLGATSCLGVWLRRRRPVGFAVVTVALSVYSMSAAGVALIALCTAAAHRRPKVVGPIVAGALLVPFLTPLVRPDVQAPPWWQVLLGFACVAAVLAWGMFIRARRESLRERARRVESERELHLAQVRQAERDQIAREMHDVLAHRLSLLSLHAGALELRPDAAPEEVALAAGVIRDGAHRALEELREVIGMLRAGLDRSGEGPEQPQPTLADLSDLVDQSRRAGMRVLLDCQVGEPAAAPAAIGRGAYRIVQEGLTNARKHGRDGEVSVAVGGAAGEGLTVEVRNPAGAAGAGIPGGGSGLIGLAERAGLAGGRLEYGPTATGEFRLRAWLPWPR
ncbi:histidine kinase [Herbidospora sp. NBRC 101105]|uniref:sensor histidine kinase n=1 Tax=Herbidospora sp. NBRC 101105 TaxID=3032195 RepID=UPI0025563A81|nr:histidine kinase [Herbidospora sp. NBRC 101105]